MKNTRLGSSGLKISRISLGYMSYGDGSRKHGRSTMTALPRSSGRPSCAPMCRASDTASMVGQASCRGRRSSVTLIQTNQTINPRPNTGAA